MNHVQSFINNISFPKTLDELYWFATEHGCFNVEDILLDDITEWTVPAWAKIGDIVFFMHAKTANSHISRLRTELKNNPEKYSGKNFKLLSNWLDHGSSLYKLYGGKIFAIGIIMASPKQDHFGEEEKLHWGSRIYADIDIVSILKNPIDISDFNDFIKISRQSGITPVVGQEFNELRKRISASNSLPNSVWNCDAIPLPLSKVNHTNWFMLTNEYRRHFLLELQFRHFYVDHLLAEIGDQKTFFSECRCIKHGHADSFADNIILIGGKYLPVEVKLSVSAQRNLPAQVSQYCENSEIILNFKNNRKIMPSQIYQNNVLIIDTDKLYFYNHQFHKIEPIYELDNLKSSDNIAEIRKIIIKKSNS